MTVFVLATHNPTCTELMKLGFIVVYLSKSLDIKADSGRLIPQGKLSPFAHLERRTSILFTQPFAPGR